MVVVIGITKLNNNNNFSKKRFLKVENVAVEEGVHVGCRSRRLMGAFCQPALSNLL